MLSGYHDYFVLQDVDAQHLISIILSFKIEMKIKKTNFQICFSIFDFLNCSVVMFYVLIYCR